MTTPIEHDHTHPSHHPESGEVPPEVLAQMRQATQSRRNFLKACGLAATSLVLANCGGEPQHVVPSVREEQGIKPGLSYWYASTCGGCNAQCGVIGRVRDGRPIKLEGNAAHPLSRGGLCAKGQASLLGLYDADRLQRPRVDGREVSWEKAYTRLTGMCNDAKSIRLVLPSTAGPSLRRAMETFTARYQSAQVLWLDACGQEAMLDANDACFGVRALPAYHFERAALVVSFAADFLGSWISPVQFARDWAEGRNLETQPEATRLVMLETGMSLTGSNADQRHRILPSERPILLAGIFHRLARRAGLEGAPAMPQETPAQTKLADQIAESLWQQRGKSLVVLESDDVAQQVLVNAMNHVLGSYGATLSLATPVLTSRGETDAAQRLCGELEAGAIDLVITAGVNPVYSAACGQQLAAALGKVGFAALCDRLDETADLASVALPVHHFLEDWNDHEAQQGLFSLSQPMTRPIFHTEATGQILLRLGASDWASRPWRAFIRDTWRTNILSAGDPRWEECVERGVLDKRRGGQEPAFRPEALASATPPEVAAAASGSYALTVFESTALGDGRHANNPWLQELPDPITKATWDNFALISPAGMKALGLKDGDVVRLRPVADQTGPTLELPALAQPGQAEGSVSVALGYGRQKAGRLGQALSGTGGVIGANAFPFRGINAVRIEKTANKRVVARSQIHDSQEGRPLAVVTSLAQFRKDPSAGTPAHHEPLTMWPKLEHKGHYWGMAVDLNACTGCSGCVVGCQVENNIPVVGRDEVALQRDMAWLRIDRYYSEDESSAGDLSQVANNPLAVHQPMMCQHCDNAPCETVCPVAATTHSKEGLNQQTYNRCVGTRYCANNCPYKVRRFNWFDYAHDDPTMNLVLNPDVAIRSRGVMEKCSLCVQRIYEAKLEAAREGRPVADGDFKTACEQSCPTQAIVVGDLNDPNSRVSRLRTSKRAYEVLGELNVMSGVRYLTKVRADEKA